MSNPLSSNEISMWIRTTALMVRLISAQSLISECRVDLRLWRGMALMPLKLGSHVREGIKQPRVTSRHTDTIEPRKVELANDIRVIIWIEH